MEMPVETAALLCEMARMNLDEEICGFIKYDWSVEQIRNVADDKGRTFEMDEGQLVEFLSRNSPKALAGVFHSHPRGNPHPSDADETFAYPYYRYFIVTFDAIHEWKFTNGGPISVRRDGSTCPRHMAEAIYQVAEKVRCPNRQDAT